MNPYFAMLRFEVQDEDMFGEPNFIGQAVYPVRLDPLTIRLSLTKLLSHRSMRCEPGTEAFACATSTARRWSWQPCLFTLVFEATNR